MQIYLSALDCERKKFAAIHKWKYPFGKGERRPFLAWINRPRVDPDANTPTHTPEHSAHVTFFRSSSRVRTASAHYNKILLVYREGAARTVRTCVCIRSNANRRKRFSRHICDAPRWCEVHREREKKGKNEITMAESTQWSSLDHWRKKWNSPTCMEGAWVK